MSAVCHIVCAGEKAGLPIVCQGDLLIAVDGGCDYLIRAGLKPDILIGDFDSLSELPKDVEALRLPAEKNDTDTFAAVRYGISRGYKEFRLYCATGGRFDHTFANVQTLSFLARQGYRARIEGKGEIYVVIQNETFTLPVRDSGYVSVFALSGRASGVTIENLRYELRDAELTDCYPVGVSNEFSGKQAYVKAEEGSLLIVFQTQAEGV